MCLKVKHQWCKPESKFSWLIDWLIDSFLLRLGPEKRFRVYFSRASCKVLSAFILNSWHDNMEGMIFNKALILWRFFPGVLTYIETTWHGSKCSLIFLGFVTQRNNCQVCGMVGRKECKDKKTPPKSKVCSDFFFICTGALNRLWPWLCGLAGILLELRILSHGDSYLCPVKFGNLLAEGNANPRFHFIPIRRSKTALLGVLPCVCLPTGSMLSVLFICCRYDSFHWLLVH